MSVHALRPRRARYRPPSACPSSLALALGALALLSIPAAVSADVPPAGTIVATMAVATPRDVTAAFGSIWVSNGPTRTVTRLDPASDAVLAVVHVPDSASVLTSGAGSMWLTSFPGNSLTKIDPATNTAVSTISLAPAGEGPVGVTVYDGFVWVANHDGEPTSSVSKIDPSDMQVVDVIPVGNASFAGPQWISGGAGSLWVDVPSISAVVRIGAATDRIVATIPDKGACGGLVAGDTEVWVAGGDPPGCLPGITRIDPATNSITAYVNVGGPTSPITGAGPSVWYGSDESDFLGRVDVSSSTVVGQLKLPGPAFGLASGYGFVWVTDRVDGLLFKVMPA